MSLYLFSSIHTIYYRIHLWEKLENILLQCVCVYIYIDEIHMHII